MRRRWLLLLPVCLLGLAVIGHSPSTGQMPPAEPKKFPDFDSVMLSLRIQSIHPIRQGVLLNLNDVFMTNFAQLPLGSFDSSRSTWAKVKGFPRNVEFQVSATFTGGRGADTVIDGRGTTVV